MTVRRSQRINAKQLQQQHDSNTGKSTIKKCNKRVSSKEPNDPEFSQKQAIRRYRKASNNPEKHFAYPSHPYNYFSKGHPLLHTFMTIGNGLVVKKSGIKSARRGLYTEKIFQKTQLLLGIMER